VIDVVYKGRFTPEDRVEQLYRSFVFEVPEGAPGVQVDVLFTKTATAALDVGISDPNGFRGWSGSERQHVEIGRGASTPGYLAGDIPAGRWSVEIGLHRVPEEGLEYEIRPRIDDVTPAATQVDAPPLRTARRRDLPADLGLEWCLGDLGVHTRHSNGSETVPELAELAIGQGLDFLVVADFNTTSHHRDLEALKDWPIILIPGQTIAIDSGHSMIVGVRDWADLRDEPEAWAGRVRSKGGLVCACYPTREDVPWRVPLAQGPDLVEIWTGPRRSVDPAAVDWWRRIAPRAIPIGSSGWIGGQGSQELGRPATWVQARNGDIVAGLHEGRTAVSADPDGPVILRQAGDVVALGATGCDLVDWDGSAVAIIDSLQRVPANDSPYFLDDVESAP
jgi:hypothetical protein